MAMSLADLEALSQAAARVDANPVGLAGRLFGLSAAEQRSGAAAWGWAAVALGAGIVAGVWLERTKKLPSFGGSG